MAGFKIDLTGLAGITGKVVPKPLRKAAGAINDAHDAFERTLDRTASPIASRRVAGCTLATRAHVTGIADITGVEYQYEVLQVTLLRLRVERPDGDAETCVRQYVPRSLRRLAVGSSVRALAHPEDPRLAYVDWHETAKRLGYARAAVPDTMEQFAWPGPEDWPAPGRIEVRDKGRYAKRLEERRAAWAPATARILGASGGDWDNGRQRFDLVLDVGGRRAEARERVPDLAVERLLTHREVGTGIVTKVETVVNAEATLVVLAGPGGEVAVDWPATFAQEEWQAAA